MYRGTTVYQEASRKQKDVISQTCSIKWNKVKIRNLLQNDKTIFSFQKMTSFFHDLWGFLRFLRFWSEIALYNNDHWGSRHGRTGRPCPNKEKCVLHGHQSPGLQKMVPGTPFPVSVLFLFFIGHAGNYALQADFDRAPGTWLTVAAVWSERNVSDMFMSGWARRSIQAIKVIRGPVASKRQHSVLIRLSFCYDMGATIAQVSNLKRVFVSTVFSFKLDRFLSLVFFSKTDFCNPANIQRMSDKGSKQPLTLGRYQTRMMCPCAGMIPCW